MSETTKEHRPVIERLMFPGICLIVSISMIYEQIAGDYRKESMYYVLAIAGPVFALSLIDMIVQLRGDANAKRKADAGDSPPPQFMDKTYVRPVLAAVTALAGVLLLNVLGYFLVFPALVILIMLIAGMRSALSISLVAAGVLLVVHFIFVGLLGLDLPVGQLFN